LSLEDWHLVFVSVCMVLILAAFTPVVMSYLPERNEPFMALAVLGEEGMAEKYYPDDDPNIEPEEDVEWQLYLYNHMGEAQYVSVKVKVSNSTTEPPNSTSCTPSPAPVAYNIRRVLLDNETWITPFTWMIENTSTIDEAVEIEAVSFNEDVVMVDALSEHGYNFRIIFELWVYNPESDGFQFGWSYGEEQRCAWNQIWFNSTKTR